MEHSHTQPNPNSLSASGNTIDLKQEIARLKLEHDWLTGHRHGRTIVKDDGINVALLVMKRGEQIHPHQTKGPITIQVIDGRITVTLAGQSHTLTPGILFALDRWIHHSVEILEESAFILTVGAEVEKA
jgi:quercetin dioxygenase-like cupin family protein